MHFNIHILVCLQQLNEGRDQVFLILTDLLSLKHAFAFPRDRSGNVTLLSG